jgi:L-asparaginase
VWSATHLNARLRAVRLSLVQHVCVYSMYVCTACMCVQHVCVQTGFRKPIIVTGSQLPLALPRSDARQNLIDSVTCLTAFFNPPHVQLREVAVCFGGRLMRGNRCQKTHSSFYQAFDSLTYPYLANLGVDVDWNKKALLQVEGVYRPRFQVF